MVGIGYWMTDQEVGESWWGGKGERRGKQIMSTGVDWAICLLCRQAGEGGQCNV